MKCANGSESIMSRGPFSQLIRVLNCPCSDGKVRSIRVTGQPQTVWTIPASTRVRGKTVTGFLTSAPTYKEGVKEGYVFYSNKFGKNGGLLP
jgi:hypothetical protein